MNSSGEPEVDPPRLILKPKLRAPVPRHEQVIRPRLLELLGTASHRKITLVSAPAVKPKFGPAPVLSDRFLGN